MARELRSNSTAPNLWPITNTPVSQRNMSGTAAPAPAPSEWKVNPYHGNFNPATKTGQAIFKEKTQGLPIDARLDLTKVNAPKLLQYLKARDGSMGNLVRKVPIPGGLTANLLTQHSSITLFDVQRDAQRRYATALNPGDPIPATPFTATDLDPANSDPDKTLFYERVHSAVVAEIVKNGLTPSGWEDLMLYKDDFSFLDNITGELLYDGPTMIKIIFDKIDPDTLVGMESMKTQLETAKLSNFNNDVAAMLTKMESIKKTLKDNGHDPESYRRYIYNALLTAPNQVFTSYIQRIVDDLQAGIGHFKDTTAEQIIQAARTKYNNMVEDKSWAKVDPRDAQLLALATEVETLRRGKTNKEAAANATDKNDKVASSGSDDMEKISGVAKWRMVKVGSTKTVDGKLHYWCPKHVHKGGLWNGLYVTHKPENHDEHVGYWQKKNKEDGKSANATETATPASAASSTSNPALGLQSRLKEVMCTNLCMSSDDVNKLFDLANQEN